MALTGARAPCRRTSGKRRRCRSAPWCQGHDDLMVYRRGSPAQVSRPTIIGGICQCKRQILVGVTYLRGGGPGSMVRVYLAAARGSTHSPGTKKPAKPGHGSRRSGQLMPAPRKAGPGIPQEVCDPAIELSRVGLVESWRHRTSHRRRHRARRPLYRWGHLHDRAGREDRGASPRPNG